MENYILNDGFAIPKVGLGTYGLRGELGVRQIETAIQSGYRLIDSAYNYENEGIVGKAIRNSGVSRDQITLTSKLPGRYHEYDKAMIAIQESIARTGLNYIDLYLIHWPNPKEDKYVEAWQALIDAQKLGLIRSIGTSNFLPEHIDRLEKETGILPAVNQVETHPNFNQEAQREYDASKGIITEAWSPIGRAADMMSNDLITAIAQAHNKTEYQVILRWHIQRGFLPIPKSGNYQRQRQNIDIFDFNLSEGEVAKINSMSHEDGRQKDQNPAEYQEF
ncbi:aldo/keto reductase [Ruoffia sp. FAM 20857]|uniref:aldo/keto reductase n=1 Tax=Ruoffia sp. FAM 20857 TaxID=3259515 RepID=UPI003889A567